MNRTYFTFLLMSLFVKPHNWPFLRIPKAFGKESRKIKKKTGFPLKNCGNDKNISNILSLMVSLLTLIIIYGCATPEMTGVSETMVLNEPPRVDVPKAKPEPLKAEEIPSSKEAGLFSLSVRDTDIRDIFLLLSKDSGVNIIADKDITGKISIDFTSLDLNSALYAITRQLGYTFRMDKGFIRVCKPILETKSFHINYITGKRYSSSTMSAAIFGGDTSGGMSPGRSTNINIATTPGSLQSTSTTSSIGQGNVNVTTSGTSDFWKEIRKGLEVIIFGDTKGGSESEGSYSRGDSSGKKLIVSELAGIAHVTDYSDNIERIEDFLNDVEKAVRKQVMIQAHIIEVSLNDTYTLGINWELLTGSGKGVDGELFSFSQNLVLNPATKVFQMDVSGKKITALLDAMKEQGQVNVLSSPKVSTMNNQKAVIKLTTKEVSWVTNTFLNADGTVVLSYTTPQIDEVGLFLDVTPQIDDNGIITMQIHPSISEKIRDSISPDGKSSKPVIDVREVDAMIKVKNGQTIVIAGLITDKITDSTRRVPLLGDIPLLGALFRQTSQDKKKSELVILLTPYILNDQSVEDIRKEHEERMKKAGRTFEPVPVIRQKTPESK
jgi:MSHA biogenesis protein MshL